MVEMSCPASWTTQDVDAWARQAKLSNATILALAENEIDGPTLVTLTKSDLKMELGITSLPARRYLWELIQSLCFEQEYSDCSVAIQAHQEEIQTLNRVGETDTADEASGARVKKVDAMVVQQLISDAQCQRQIIDDHLFAHRLQRTMAIGEQSYEDVMVARAEQERLNQLSIRSEYDRQYAVSLLTRRERRAQGLVETNQTDEVPTLFGLCVNSCAQNHVNVAEAFESGRIKTVVASTSDDSDDESSKVSASSLIQVDFAEAIESNRIKTSSASTSLCNDSEDKLSKKKASSPRRIKTSSASKSLRDGSEEEPSKKQASSPRRIKTFSASKSLSDGSEEETSKKQASSPLYDLPKIDQCNVCYNENIRGYTFACNHRQCIDCTRSLLRTALGDNTLLPLRCCELPIDMNIARHLLPQQEADRILFRVEEIQATNKMYCSSCSNFINLDLVDSTYSNELHCGGCNTLLCTSCKTVAHPGLSCRENKASISGSNELLLELSREKGWKQCPGCATMIELRSGCNHMTCTHCRHEFCYRCLRPWNSENGTCSSGTCELWEEDRLIEAGEARVQAEEAIRGRALPQHVRRERLARAYDELRMNEVCNHDWRRRQGNRGNCENCGYELWAYGMVCNADCGSTVCYTCAHHRIPQQGWR